MISKTRSKKSHACVPLNFKTIFKFVFLFDLVKKFDSDPELDLEPDLDLDSEPEEPVKSDPDLGPKNIFSVRQTD